MVRRSPRHIKVEWLGYQIETNAFIGALAVIAIVVLRSCCWRYSATSSPARPRSLPIRARRKQQGLDALSRGLLAIGVGDRALSQRYAGIARRNLPNEPLTALLRAQAAQLKGDRAGSRRAFEAMLDRPETELLGVRGLFLEAKRGNDIDAARALAERAVKRDPKLAWGVAALFDLQARAGDWEGALNTLAIAKRNGDLDPDITLRRRAVLLTAEARDAEGTDPEKALALANEALRLAPSLVPAAEIAGRILVSKGETRAASRLVSRTWKLAPHPSLALVYAFAKPGEPPRDRLNRIKHLAGLAPADIEGHIAVANAAIEAHEWQEARAALEPYLADRPPARICTLMARIESGEFGDTGREREWLGRALRAPRDRAWIADGYVSDRWLPVSPVTGAVDAFEWKAPVDAIGRGDTTLIIEDRSVLPARPAQVAPPALAPAEPPRRTAIVEVTQVEAALPEPSAAKAEAPKRPERGKPALYVPDRPPDDPGVVQADPDESPTSLERLRAAQIR